MIQCNQKKKRVNYFLYFSAVTVNLLALAVGSAFSWTSPVLPMLNGQTKPEENPISYKISTSEESWITSSLHLGAILGPAFTVSLADRLGRKKTLLFFAVPMVLSHIICAFANSVYLFCFARIMVGIGCGCMLTVLPIYLSEIAEVSIRGKLGCLISLNTSLGNVYNYILGPFVNITILSFLNLLPLVVAMVFFGFFIPDTPYYYLSKNDKVSAKNSLRKFRESTENELHKELLYISESLEHTQTKKSFLDLFRTKTARKSMFIANGLVLFQGLTGIIPIIAFLEQIFESSGSGISSVYSTLLIGSMQVLSTSVTLNLIENLGRRLLLLVSVTGTFLSLTILGLYFYLKQVNYDLEMFYWLPITSLVCYILSYSLGIGPVPYFMIGEIFPTSLKPLASGFVSCFFFLLSFAIAFAFPHLNAIFGMHGAIWLFSGCMVVAFMFVLLVMPETKGKSLKEIQELLENETKEILN